MYSSVKGTQDYLFNEARVFRFIEASARNLFSLYNYSEIVLPSLEKARVFLRGVGQASDIATKQMYFLSGKDDIVLRPEGTSQVVRAYIQHHLDGKSELAKFFPW
jgi:histidyl-tRNA synthetase